VGGALLATVGLLSSSFALGPAATGVAAPSRAAGGAAAPNAPGAKQAALTRPSASSGPADQITYEAARLRGTIDSGGQATAYFFLYGTTTTYGSQSPTASLVAGSAPVTVYSQIGGLMALTEYHYRLVAIKTPGDDVRRGSDVHDILDAPLDDDRCVSRSRGPGWSAAHRRAIDGTGDAGSAVVLQADPFPFTTGFQIVGDPGLATATGGFAFDVGSVGVTTEFRVVGVGSGQPLVSDTLTEFVRVAVTMSVTHSQARGGAPEISVSGAIRPAEVGARVSVQRLVGGSWMLVAATKSAAAASDSSAYAITLHPLHSGLYRVFEASVEGGHLSNCSASMTVRVHG
jgi:hypothetical protein